MKTSILAALIAATALSPIAASAQDRRERPMRQGDGAPRQRPDVNREAFRQQREASRAQWQGQAQREQRRPEWMQRIVQGRPQPAAQAPQPDRDARWRPGDQPRRAFREERRDDRRDFERERRDDRRALADGRVTPDQFRRDRRDDVRDYRRDRADDRRDFRRDWADGRRDWNGRDDWNGRRDWGRNDWGWRGDNRWDRGWRSDRRYDWNGWRDRNRQAYRLPRYYPPRGYGFGYQRFGIGVTLGSFLFAQNYWIGDPWAYRLPPAYGPYRWVRYYNDALLVDVETGEVVDAIHDIFW